MIADDFDAIARGLNDLQQPDETAKPPVEPDTPLWMQPIFVQLDADVEAALEAILDQLRQIEDAAGDQPEDADMSDSGYTI